MAMADKAGANPTARAELDGDTVIRHYRAILRREPQPQEIRLWTGAAGISRSAAALGEALIRQATEVRSIARLYAGLLGRLPDGLDSLPGPADGLSYWTGILREFRLRHRSIGYRECLAYCIEDWFGSPEHQELFPRDLGRSEFADRLCRRLAGRPMEPGDAWWQATPDEARASLAVAIAESSSCKNHLNETINERLLATARAGTNINQS